MKRQVLRHTIQAVFFLLTLYFIYSIYTGIIAVAHSVCPNSVVCFGAPGVLNNFYAFVPALIAGLVILITSMFFGRYFCSYVCFFGTLQEKSYQIFRKKGKLKPKISHLYERKLGVIKYLVLLFTLVSALFFGIHYYQNFCPVIVATSLNHISWQDIIIILIFTVVAFFSSRFWCRFLCPFGALMNVFQYLGNILRIPRLRIHRNMEVCIDCNLCNKTCPMNINISEVEIVENVNCIHCGECIARCPKNMALLEKSPK